MKALLYKRKHISKPWMLAWTINGLQYRDTFHTKADALDYANAMCFLVETVDIEPISSSPEGAERRI